MFIMCLNIAQAHESGPQEHSRGQIGNPHGSFQAPEFYRNLGYVDAGHIPDLPPGHNRVHLQKRFAPVSD